MLFVSKIRDLRLIRKPADRIMDEQRRPIILKGERVEFSNFRFQTEDQDVIDWLTSHPLYGREFTSDRKKDKAVPKESYQPIVTDDEVKPKIKKPVGLPTMVQGAMATARGVPEPVEVSGPQKQALTEAKVAEMIDSRLEKATASILDAIKNLTPTKAQRTFHCPECGEEFASSFQVGKHKKAAHAAPTEVKE